MINMIENKHLKKCTIEICIVTARRVMTDVAISKVSDELAECSFIRPYLAL